MAKLRVNLNPAKNRRKKIEKNRPNLGDFSDFGDLSDLSDRNGPGMNRLGVQYVIGSA